MFYEEKEISELIICPYCKTKFTDPRLLPCGVSLCYDCIQLIANNEFGNVKCVCTNFHAIPVDGFIVNSTLAKLVEKKPYEVYRSSIVEEFKLNLNSFKQKIDSLINKMRRGGENITEYCNNIKNHIQLKTEETIEAIKQHSMEYLKQIDDYQVESLSNYDKDVARYENSRNELKKFEEFYVKWSGYLSKYSITEDDVLNANEEVLKLMNDVCREHDEFKSKLFGYNLIKFRENQDELESDLIGHVLFENMNLENSVKQINKKENTINCAEFIREASFVDLVTLTNNEIHVISNGSRNGVINMFAIDYEGNLIKQRAIQPPKNAAEIKFLKAETINKENNLEVLYLFAKYKFSGNSKYITRVYNQNLDFLFEKEINFRNSSITIYNRNIYSLMKTNHQGCLLCVYDENLNELKRFGQHDENLGFYFPDSTQQILINEHYFILLDQNDDEVYINVMDRSTGRILSSSLLEGDKNNSIRLYFDRFILGYSKNSGHLECFDLENLENIEEREIVYAIERKSSSFLDLIGCSNKSIFFFDHTKRLIIYSK